MPDVWGMKVAPGLLEDWQPLEDQIRAAQRLVEQAPPAPRCIIARDDVPAGRLYRQWNTRGELIVYVNASILDAVPRQEAARSVIVGDLAPVFGIPIVFEDVDRG